MRQHGDVAIRWWTAFIDLPADQFEVGAGFWESVTGSVRSAPRGATGQFATLVPPEGDAFLRVQRVTDGCGGIHIDHHTDSAPPSSAESSTGRP